MLSIITVCYNAENCIEITLKSILQQNYNDFEYIIIDGNSKDKTNYIIKKYYKSFKEKKIKLCHIVESDKGIYDAMNKGIKNATGEWICFMNAGDRFYSKDILKTIFSEQVLDVDIIYGDVKNVEDDFEWIEKAKDIEYILQNMPFCHQSSFVRTDVIRKYMFDLNYSICADYDLFLKLYENKYTFLKKDMVIAVFDATGESNNGLFKHYFEKYKIQNKHGIINIKSISVQYKLIKFKIHDCIKFFLPSGVSKRIRNWNRKNRLKGAIKR